MELFLSTAGGLEELLLLLPLFAGVVWVGDGWGGGASLHLPGWSAPGVTGSAPVCPVQGVSGEWLWSWQVSQGLSWVFLSCCFPGPGSGRFCLDQKPKSSSSAAGRQRQKSPCLWSNPFPLPAANTGGSNVSCPLWLLFYVFFFKI